MRDSLFINPTVIAAIIGAIIGAIGSIFGIYFKYQLSKGKVSNKGIYYLDSNNNFEDIISGVDTIRMYTVNSYELVNRINALLEQKPEISLNNVVVLVRRKSTESAEDIQYLDTIISIWRRWTQKGRIRKLLILSYDHDPDHYYTIIGDHLVFTGHVFFDNSRPTGTTINYKPLLFCNDTNLGREVIEQYKKHFEHLVKMNVNNKLYSYDINSIQYQSK